MSDARDPDDADDELTRAFADAVPDVVPLSDRSPRRVPPVGQRQPPERPSAPADNDTEELGDESTYVASGIDRRELRKLARGEHRIEATLDLHGRTVEDAEPALRHFIQRCRHTRHRHVCVVTGAGHHSPAGAVLKPRVCAWLRGNPAVLAFSPAPPAGGGDGALFVRLRR